MKLHIILVNLAVTHVCSKVWVDKFCIHICKNRIMNTHLDRRFHAAMQYIYQKSNVYDKALFYFKLKRNCVTVYVQLTSYTYSTVLLDTCIIVKLRPQSISQVIRD